MKPTGCGYKATRPLTKISFDESAQCDYDFWPMFGGKASPLSQVMKLEAAYNG